MAVGAVVATDDAQRSLRGTAVLQQSDACLLIETAGLRLTGIVLVIAQTGIDGSLQPTELGGHILVHQRSHADVDDVAGYQDQVGMFGIDHIHPPSQRRASVVIAQVQVAGHHDRIVLVERLRRRHLQRHSHLVVVMDIATEEHDEQCAADCHRRDGIGVEPAIGHEVYEPSDVEYDEDDDQIEEHQDSGGAHLVEYSGQGQRQSVERAAHVEEQR